MDNKLVDQLIKLNEAEDIFKVRPLSTREEQEDTAEVLGRKADIRDKKERIPRVFSDIIKRAIEYQKNELPNIIPEKQFKELKEYPLKEITIRPGARGNDFYVDFPSLEYKYISQSSVVNYLLRPSLKKDSRFDGFIFDTYSKKVILRYSYELEYEKEKELQRFKRRKVREEKILAKYGEIFKKENVTLIVRSIIKFMIKNRGSWDSSLIEIDEGGIEMERIASKREYELSKIFLPIAWDIFNNIKE